MSLPDNFGTTHDLDYFLRFIKECDDLGECILKFQNTPKDKETLKILHQTLRKDKRYRVRQSGLTLTVQYK